MFLHPAAHFAGLALQTSQPDFVVAMLPHIAALLRASVCAVVCAWAVFKSISHIKTNFWQLNFWILEYQKGGVILFFLHSLLKNIATEYGGWYWPDIIFFLELTRLEYNAVQILATRFKYYKRVWNISNVFGTFKTRLKHWLRHLKSVWNIRNEF